MSSDVFTLDLERILELLPRYPSEGPRYTSYPTAPVWKDDYGPDDLRAELGHEDVDASDGLSLYVHVPFCESLCHYCACNKVITKDHGRALAVSVLLQERHGRNAEVAAHVSRLVVGLALRAGGASAERTADRCQGEGPEPRNRAARRHSSS